ncbi:MAG: DUF1292 domain-containing protein [Clostridiaceae bacterium]|nr:DUF1292 domain-containing protein [Clostridiaceae bacterium]
MTFEKFIEKETADYGKLYADVIFALEEIEEFVPSEQLRERKFVEYLPTLKAYMDILKNTEIDNHTKGVFAKVFGNSDSQAAVIEKFKSENVEKFDQIRSCVNCKCLTCSNECIMEGCNRCEKSGRVAKCDKKTTCIYTFTNKELQLTNNKTGEDSLYNVLSIVQDKEYNQLFIIIELNREKFVLYFYPGISEDTYGEISDVEDFNFAFSAYEQAEL